MHAERIQLRQARYTPLESGKRQPRIEERRQCRVSGCNTRLSHYNPSPTCSVHEGWRDLRQRQHG